MTRVAVSSFSLRQLMGPLSLDFPDGEGGYHHVELPYPPAAFGIAQLPHLVRERLGVDEIELVAFQLTRPGTDMQALQAALLSTGVAVLNLLIDVGDLDDSDASRRSEALRLSRYWIDVAAALGSTFARVNAGSPAKRTSRTKLAEEHLVAALQELGSYATARNVRLLVENHGGRSSDPNWLLDLLARAGREYVGLLLDLGNLHPLMERLAAHRAGHVEAAASNDLEPLFDVIAQLAPRAEALSAKSYAFDSDGRHTTYDLTRALRVAVRAGFSGPVSVEYEGEDGDPWMNCERTLDIVREAVASP